MGDIIIINKESIETEEGKSSRALDCEWMANEKKAIILFVKNDLSLNIVYSTNVNRLAIQKWTATCSVAKEL